MDTLRPFDANDVDETLTRIATYAGATYLLFPYVDAQSGVPTFKSVDCIIQGAAATIADFAVLSARIDRAGDAGGWFLSFNTPWLLNHSDAANVPQRGVGRTQVR